MEIIMKALKDWGQQCHCQNRLMKITEYIKRIKVCVKDTMKEDKMNLKLVYFLQFYKNS